jgi:hypothetical protein
MIARALIARQAAIETRLLAKTNAAGDHDFKGEADPGKKTYEEFYAFPSDDR